MAERFFFFKTSSERVLWSGCRQLFTSVTKSHYTQFSDALKRRTHLDINVLEEAVYCSSCKTFPFAWIWRERS